MKKSDLFFFLFLCGLFLPFLLFPVVYDFYEAFNRDHGMASSFLKFAILATSGELLGLRIRSGVYFRKGFGILPRALVWGFLGWSINLAFIVFSLGTPAFLSSMGLVLTESWGGRIFTAFSISTAMNVIFAPVMMTLHKITDTHILNQGGTLAGLFRRIDFSGILSRLDWETQWRFIFCRTIPLFWIPAHTITFLLPPESRVLFAAILGVLLGVILAFANLKGKITSAEPSAPA